MCLRGFFLFVCLLSLKIGKCIKTLSAVNFEGTTTLGGKINQTRNIKIVMASKKPSSH